MTDESLLAHNERAAGMRGGCLPYALATVAVTLVLAVPALLILVLRWLIGGAQ